MVEMQLKREIWLRIQIFVFIRLYITFEDIEMDEISPKNMHIK